jgi:endonuclease-3
MAGTSEKIVEERNRRAKAILPVLMKTYPNAKCSLDFHNPLQLLVATILSAQCTDKRVNMVTPGLFKKYPKAADYAKAPLEEFEQEIKSTGFYRNKAKSIIAMARELVEKYGGEVPRSMEELTSLPGVGRKTANVVLGNAFGISVGVVVDTHVARLSERLGLSTQKSAEKIELDLMEVVPKERWTLWSHLMIHHGRAICMARGPLCDQCPIFTNCPTGPKILAEKKAAKVGKRK